jgi:hypothetical protein
MRNNTDTAENTASTAPLPPRPALDLVDQRMAEFAKGAADYKAQRLRESPDQVSRLVEPDPPHVREGNQRFYEEQVRARGNLPNASMWRALTGADARAVRDRLLRLQTPTLSQLAATVREDQAHLRQCEALLKSTAGEVDTDRATHTAASAKLEEARCLLDQKHADVKAAEDCVRAASGALTAGRDSYEKLDAAQAKLDAAHRAVRAAQSFVEAAEIAEKAARGALEEREAELKTGETATAAAEVKVLRGKAAQMVGPVFDKIDDLRAATVAYGVALARLRNLDRHAADDIAPHHLWKLSGLLLTALLDRFSEGK